MFSKKMIYSLLVLCTLAANYAQAQNAIATTDAKTTANVDINALKAADVARKQQLLEQSSKLQDMYMQQLGLISKTELSLNEAKQRCYETCTKPEISSLLTNLDTLSASVGGTVIVANTLRLILAGMDPDLTGAELSTRERWLERGSKSFVRPYKTVAGSMMLGSTILFTGSVLLQNFLSTKDIYSKSQIQQFDADLKNFKAELVQIERNISITNAAISQSLKVEQVSIVREKTTVGY